jgi:urease accessory protein
MASMKPASCFRPFWSVMVMACLMLPVLASAHPGHDHADIPSVIRHPFAGPDHMLITAAVLFGTGATLVVAARALQMSPRLRWAGGAMMAVAVAVLFV